MARKRSKRPYTGLGWVRPLESGRFQACWRNEAGRTRTHTVDTETEAEQYLLAINGQRHAGQYLDPRAGDITLERFATEWLATLTPDPDPDLPEDEGEGPISQSTLDLYDLYLRRHILPPQGTSRKVHLGAMRVADITEPAVQDWVTKLSSKRSSRNPKKPRDGEVAAPPKVLSPKYVANVHGCLHAIMQAAVRAGHRRDNPCVGVRLPVRPELRIHAPTPEEFWAVWYLLPPWAQDVAEYAAFSGLRIGEVAGLLRRDLKLGGTVRVEEAVKDRKGHLSRGRLKTAKSRRVVPPNANSQAAVDRALARFPDASPDEPIFRAAKGGPLRARVFYRAWVKAVERASIPHCRVHDLRHAFGTWLVRDGADVTEVQALMGHGQLSTTQQYLDIDEDQLRSAVSRLDGRGRRGTSPVNTPPAPRTGVRAKSRRTG